MPESSERQRRMTMSWAIYMMYLMKTRSWILVWSYFCDCDNEMFVAINF